jgi:hypothetical protein
MAAKNNSTLLTDSTLTAGQSGKIIKTSGQGWPSSSTAR